MAFFIQLLNKQYAIHIASFFIALVLFVFFSGSGVPVVLNGYLEKNRAVAFKYIDDSNRISEDVRKALNSLNSLNFDEECGSDMLKAMRFAQFEATYVKDVGYSSENRLLCTSGLGKLEKPFDEAPPKVILPDGGSLWLNVPIKLFDFEKKSHVLKVGHYNVVFNISDIEKSVGESKNAAVYIMQKNNRPFFYRGNRDIVPADWDSDTDFSFSGMTSIVCSEKSYFCSATYTSYADVIKYEKSLIFGIVSLSLLSSLFITKLLYERLKKLNDIKYRFRYGLSADRILCYYQPIVEITSGRIDGFEVLCRWVDYDGSVVSPDNFLNFVKQLNLTKEFTAMVIDKTFDELDDHLRKHSCMKISFNVFPSDFNVETIEDLMGIYKKRYPKAVINVELTEDELVEITQAAACADELRLRGYTIAIDDFGKGYSSLSYLREIKADFIKIDRSFVKEIEKGAIKANLIPNIVSIADSLGSQVIAEGIELKEQIDYLASFNVVHGQGYFFSRPVPAKDFMALFCGDKLC